MTTNTPKTPRANAISRILKTAGFLDADSVKTPWCTDSVTVYSPSRGSAQRAAAFLASRGYATARNRTTVYVGVAAIRWNDGYRGPDAVNDTK